jgi:hypothetical protein
VGVSWSCSRIGGMSCSARSRRSLASCSPRARLRRGERPPCPRNPGDERAGEALRVAAREGSRIRPGRVSCGDRQPSNRGPGATPALHDLQSATRLADTAQPHNGIQGHRLDRPTPRGRRTPQNQPEASPGLGRPSPVERMAETTKKPHHSTTPGVTVGTAETAMSAGSPDSGPFPSSLVSTACSTTANSRSSGGKTNGTHMAARYPVRPTRTHQNVGRGTFSAPTGRSGPQLRSRRQQVVPERCSACRRRSSPWPGRAPPRAHRVRESPSTANPSTDAARLPAFRTHPPIDVLVVWTPPRPSLLRPVPVRPPLVSVLLRAAPSSLSLCQPDHALAIMRV